MGKIIDLGEGHKFEWPEEPEDKTKILFHDKPKKKQFWVRDNTIPEVFYKFNPAVVVAEETTYRDDGFMLTISAEDSKLVTKLVDREMERRTNGVWFYNKGEATWLAPGHYFSLQWCAISGYKNPYDGGSEYGRFYKFQARVHYFLQMCKLDEECGGGFIGKAKKTGLTLLISHDLLNESTMTRGKRFLMMSKTGDDAQSTNFMYYTYALDNLPLVFWPAVSKRNESVVMYNEPLAKSTGTLNSILKQQSRSNGLNSAIEIKNTVANAFDGPLVHRGVLDEIAKYPKPNGPKNVFTKSSESVKLGNTIEGKLWLFCYPPEDDDDSYREAKKIWYDSALTTRDTVTKRTLTGLYQHFVSSLDSDAKYIDEYGDCDKKTLKALRVAELEQRRNDPQKVQAYIRQYPQYADQMWEEGGGGGSTFDNVRLGAQKQRVNEKQIKDPSFEWGNFKWAGKPWRSLVTWVPLSEADILAGKQGSFRWYHKHLTDQTQLNIPMKRVLAGQDQTPKVVKLSPFGGTWDPANYIGKKDVVTGSKHAGVVGSMLDIARDTLMGRPASNMLHMVYFDRHINPDDDMMNLVFMMLFWGCPMYVEANVPWMIQMAVKFGLESFLMVRQEGQLVPYNKHLHTSFPVTNKAVIENYVKEIASYIAQADLGEVDYLLFLEDERIIQQLMGFEQDNTKKYDLAVVFGFWRILMSSLSATLARRMKQAESKQYDGIPDAMRMLVGAKMPPKSFKEGDYDEDMGHDAFVNKNEFPDSRDYLAQVLRQ